MALDSPILPAAPVQTQRQAQTFEFTKRKNWADILLSELPDTVILVLDTDAQIQYVGPTSNEVLGWEAEELSETVILDIVNDDDKKAFNDHFERSLSSRQDLFCYARLKCKPASKQISERGAQQKELLFEIRGHALYVPNDNECKCFFLSAKPFPSRNMAALNTFLELKIENERLTQRLKDLKSQEDVIPGRIYDPPVSVPQDEMSDSQFTNIEFSRSQEIMIHRSTGRPAGNFNTTQDGFIHSTARSVNSDEEGGKKKKKSKKTHATAQQYVCVICGRTDSPEWRKGPRGPKTLCNACGLRWAKRSKRTDDVPIPYVQGQGSRKGQEGTRSTTPASVTSGRGAKGMPVSHPALSVTPTTGTPSTAQPVQQPQVRQERYDSQNPSTSPAQPAISQTSMAPQRTTGTPSATQPVQHQERYDSQLPSASPIQPVVSQTSMAPQPQPSSTAGQYAMHALAAAAMHHQNARQPLASPHEFVNGQTQAHYHGYELYPWLMNQQQREGGYGC